MRKIEEKIIENDSECILGMCRSISKTQLKDFLVKQIYPQINRQRFVEEPQFRWQKFQSINFFFYLISENITAILTTMHDSCAFHAINSQHIHRSA